MGCGHSKSLSPRKPTSPEPDFPSNQETPETRELKEEVLLRIPGSTVHLMDEGESVELAKGDFTIVRLADENVLLATFIKVGDDLQWPLTKDEPVVKLDSLQYLFSMPMKDGDLLSYGVTFSEQSYSNLASLDSFLKENSCFLCSSSGHNRVVNWRNFAPAVEDYNGVLAKAVAGGTGEIVKGIFKCSNAYSKQVEKGGEMILNCAEEEKNGIYATDSMSNSNRSGSGVKKNKLNKGLKRVRKLSKMTERMSKSMLNGIGYATGSVATPVIRSQTGKAILAMVPGQVLLASLDGVNKVLDAVEAAERQALSSTSRAATRMVSQRFGESAGEATGDVLATAGHCAGTAWNIFKIRKAINPATSVPSAVLKNAVKNRKR
ncbi:hypothetical protein HHK36_021693 [Tetracentron sinense]|uniref:Senescence domain-containing protein n=1 Tax=Tetracentron sinense TaxID=13715 RepID=A0A834YQ82_TETSI|nr:hypothetical protein HHK36_021693 [Tetracentron sinense]